MSTGDMRPARTTEHLGLPVPGDAEPADAPTDIGDLADALDALYSRLLFQPGDIKASAAAVPGSGWLLCDGQAIDRTQFADLFTAIGEAYGPGDGSTTFNVPDLRGKFAEGADVPANVGVKGGAATVALTAAEMPYHAHSGATTNDNVDHSHFVPNHGTSGHTADHSHSGWTDSQYAAGGGWVPTGSWSAYSPGSSSAGGNYPRSGYPPSSHSTAHSHNVGTYGASSDHAHYAGNLWTGGANTRHAHGIYGEGGGAAHTNLPPFQMVNYFVKT